MELTDVVKNKNTMSFIIKTKDSNCEKSFNLKKIACEIKFTSLKRGNDSCYHGDSYSAKDDKFSLHIKTYKKSGENNYLYNFLCRIDTNEQAKQFCCDDNWKFIGDFSMYSKTYEPLKYSVFIEVIINKPINHMFFKSLHDDVPVDFELRGVDGSVSFHKMVLAASSLVFLKMLTGKWQETTEGYAEVPQATKQTLEHFKKLLYFRELPENGLEELLFLTKYYMIEDLKQLCIDHLLFNMTPGDMPRLNEFAVQNNIIELTLALFDLAQCGEINMTEVRASMIEKDTTKRSSQTIPPQKNKRTKK